MARAAMPASTTRPADRVVVLVPILARLVLVTTLTATATPTPVPLLALAAVPVAMA